METQALTIERASAMPAATWHFLKANDALIEIPEGLAISPQVTAIVPDSAKGATDAFENALAAAQAKWEETHPEPTAEELAAHEEFLAAEADATYGGTAQSSYQISADAIEETRSLTASFEHGTGDEAAAYLRHVADKRIVVKANPGEQVEAHVTVAGLEGAISVGAIDVIAGKESAVSLSILVDGAAPCDDGQVVGIAGSTVRVFAGEGARVNVIRTQALGDGLTDIDDMGLFAADRACIDVRQTVLGASASFTGLAGDLRGEASRIEASTRYLGHGDQEHDLNYALRHHGEKTECNLQTSGVLAGHSKKTLRGTIDFVRGCKGAAGSENETVLLVDEGVHNKTVPVILCNEDDVAGSHGATIGHIRGEQLFYLASRGLSQEAAEGMFVGAVLEEAAINAPDDAARSAIVTLGEHLLPGFAELFE